MIELTDIDLINLLRKNNLHSDTLQDEAVNRLTAKGLKVACAESCTGGLISERITNVSGASKVFDCGICSYSNEIKHNVLGVQNTTLSVLGAVSAETAIQMAEGVRKLANANIGISTTGIAGPTGGTPEKPVGLVYLGVSTEKESYAIRFLFGGNNNIPNNRNKIRRYASDAALFMILDVTHKL